MDQVRQARTSQNGGDYAHGEVSPALGSGFLCKVGPGQLEEDAKETKRRVFSFSNSLASLDD